MKLELIVLPVADAERAKAFYGGLGWRLDADVVAPDGLRVIQLTPPGSEASVIFGERLTTTAPGAVQGLHLTVYDIEKVREDLTARGVAVSEIFHDALGVFHHAGTDARVPGPHPDRQDYSSFASFSDPDGNGWVLQEIKVRAPGR